MTSDRYLLVMLLLLIIMAFLSKEGILIDPINRTVTIYRVRENYIVWNVQRNLRIITSQILNGFVLDMQGII